MKAHARKAHRQYGSSKDRVPEGTAFEVRTQARLAQVRLVECAIPKLAVECPTGEFRAAEIAAGKRAVALQERGDLFESTIIENACIDGNQHIPSGRILRRAGI